MEKFDHIINLIQKYLRNDISPQQQQELDVWINESDENKMLFDDYKVIWEKSKSIPTDIFNIDIDNELKRFNKNAKSNKIVKLNRFTYWVSAAVATIVVVLILQFLLKPKTFEYFAKEDFLYVTLPDNSNVMMSPNSTIVFQKSFFSSKRIANLSGDAFFEVKADASHPFIVNTNDFQVVVKGTKFIVSQTKKSVSVRSGVVEVKNKIQTIVLTANQQATIDNNIMISEIPYNFSLNSVFDEIKISDKYLVDVVEILEKIFGQKILIKNKELENLKINFTISQNQSLDSVLEIISLTLDLKISKDQDNYYLQKK